MKKLLILCVVVAFSATCMAAISMELHVVNPQPTYYPSQWIEIIAISDVPVDTKGTNIQADGGTVNAPAD